MEMTMDCSAVPPRSGTGQASTTQDVIPAASLADQRNPFSTRFIRPQAQPFLFVEPAVERGIAERLRRGGHWQIVGPHGSGKTTLLYTICGWLAAWGCSVRVVRCHGRRRWRLRPVARERTSELVSIESWSADQPVALAESASSSDWLVVDGFEQLAWLDRLGVRRWCARHARGLVVTSHHGAGLATLAALEGSWESFRAVARRLEAERAILDERTIAAAYAQCRGNLREGLLTLYDAWGDAVRRGRECGCSHRAHSRPRNGPRQSPEASGI
jgi:molybdopterin-guanine dinucleotide biosynthesis protein